MRLRCVFFFYFQEYDLSDDVNTLTLARNYLAHTKRVNSTFFSLDYHWLLSCGNDKQFQWHCTKSGQRIGGYSAAKAACTCLQYPFLSTKVLDLRHWYLAFEFDIRRFSTSILFSSLLGLF